MYKKLIMSCMALVSFAAFGLPAVAAAENRPELVENGSTVAVGTKITGTLVGTADFLATDGKTLQVRCTKSTMTGSVTKNSETTVEGSITTADFFGPKTVSAHNGLEECEGSFGNAWITVPNTPLTLKSTKAMATDEFQLTDKGGSTVTFIIGSTTAGECKYVTTSSVKGDITTSATTATLAVRNTQAGSGAKLESGGFLCPTSGQLNMTFNLETDVAGGAELGIIAEP